MPDDDPSPPPSSPPEPSPPPPAAAPRRWPRRSADRYVAGVAGGVARALDVDPLVVRVATAVAVAYLPWLVAAYALAWLVLRDEATGRSLVDDASVPGRRLPALGVLALGVGAVVLAPDLGPGGDTGLTVGVVLLVAGYLLVTGQVGRGPGAGTAEAAEAGGDAPDPAAGAPPPWPPPPGRWLPGRPPRPARPPQPPRPPAHLGWAGLSALAVLVGVAAAVDQAGTGVEPGVVVSLGLVLLGAVLCVAARWDRARLLVPVGLGLLPLWVGFAASGITRYDGEGTAEHTVAAGDPVPTAFRHGYGTLDVDLTEADLAPGERRTVRIGLTAGRAEIHVAREVHLRVRGDVGVGNVDVLDRGTVWDSDLAVLAHVDRAVGDPQELCQSFTMPVEDDPSAGPADPGDPGDPGDPANPPPTTVEHYDQRTGEPCTPEPAPDPDDPEPAVLELVLDVGIGEVEIHRDQA